MRKGRQTASFLTYMRILCTQNHEDGQKYQQSAAGPGDQQSFVGRLGVFEFPAAGQLPRGPGPNEIDDADFEFDEFK